VVDLNQPASREYYYFLQPTPATHQPLHFCSKRTHRYAVVIICPVVTKACIPFRAMKMTHALLLSLHFLSSTLLISSTSQ